MTWRDSSPASRERDGGIVTQARQIVEENAKHCKECKKDQKTVNDLCSRHKKMWNAACDIDGDTAQRNDKLHHAPLCPANHYHGRRPPTGRCNCGAERNAREVKEIEERERVKATYSAFTTNTEEGR